MSTMTAVRAAMTAETTKIRSVRSTVWTLLPTFVVGVGLSVPLGLSFRTGLTDDPGNEGLRNFDPLFATFYSLTLAQLALVVFGVLVVSGEYGSGTILTSLTAVPRRGVFYVAKLSAAALPVIIVSLITVLVTFFTAQAALGSHGTGINRPGVPTALIGAVLYLTLISLFAMGVAAMLRSSVASLALLLPLFFLGSQGLGNLPKVRTVTQFLPDQAGAVIMHLTGPSADPRFGRPYGPWTGIGILVLWTAAALVGGYLVLRRRDA